MMDMACIELYNVGKHFGEKEVLRGIHLTAHKGEILGLLGPSGAGKTTLIKIMTGQLSYEGKAKILNYSCEELKRKHYEKLGIMIEECGLYERLTCMDNMMLFAGIYGIKKEAVTEILSRVGLTGHKSAVGKMSKGMKQRLILARAILHKPEILFLDEPTSGLDPQTARRIHELIFELKEQGMTVFLTTHNMEEAYKLCDHVALLNEGKIVEYGEPGEICRRYNKKQNIRILLKNGELFTLEPTPEGIKRLTACLEQGILETIHSSEPNLESVFVELTGRRLEQ